MTRPRFVVKGQLCFVTARAVRRMFQFVPQRDVVRVVQYLFAVAAERFGMRVHEALCMSNHFHVLMTDVEGRLPDFMHFFDSLLARSLNAMRGSSGSVFEKEYGLSTDTDDEKVFAHAVYTLANPCAAHLVRRSWQWPGFSTLKMNYGQTRKIERPKVGLWKDVDAEERRGERSQQPQRARQRRKPSRLPDVVEFKLERPPVYLEMSDAELRAAIWERLDARELELIEERRRAGQKVAGVAMVLAQPWYRFPAQPEELFGLKPRVAGKDKRARIGALQRLRDFEDAYARARAAFLNGVRDVVWPIGTWLMRVRFGLPCAVAPL